MALTVDDNQVHYVEKIVPKPEFPKFIEFESGLSNLKLPSGFFEYSHDGVEGEIWNPDMPNVYTPFYLRGKNPSGFNGEHIEMEGMYGPLDISGNLNALIDYENDTDTLPENAFKDLFQAYGDFRGLHNIDIALPSTILSQSCYENLFAGLGDIQGWNVKITCLATDISAEGCIKNFPQLIGQDGSTFICAKGMIETWQSVLPEGWTTEEINVGKQTKK